MLEEHLEDCVVPVDTWVDDYIQQEASRHVAQSIIADLEMHRPISAAKYAEALAGMTSAVSIHDNGQELSKGTAPQEYLTRLLVDRIPTGLSGVDTALGGGLARGELGVVVGGYNVGKTAALMNFAYNAAMRGHRCLHVTLEIHTDMVLLRYDQLLGDCSVEDIRKQPGVALKRRKQLQASGGNITIRDYSHMQFSSRLLEAVIARNPLDLVVLDYADLMVGDVQDEGAYRLAVGEVYKGLRRIASATNTAIWTASQVNRLGLTAKGGHSGANVTADISKMFTVDHAFMFWAGEEGPHRLVWSADKLRMVLPKDGKKIVRGQRFFVRVNLDSQKYSDVQEEDHDTEYRPENSREAGEASR